MDTSLTYANSGGPLQGSMGDLWHATLVYVPTVLAAVIFVIIGWVIGVILSRLIEEGSRILRLDTILRSAGVGGITKEFGFELNIGKFLGTLVLWFVTLSFLFAALQMVDLTMVTIALEQVVLFYLPHVIAATLIIILAAVVADLVKKFVANSATVAGSHHGNFAGSVAQWSIWSFAILTALTELGIASDFLHMLFAGIVFASALAGGLAFGLGGRDAASRLIERVGSDISHRE